MSSWARVARRQVRVVAFVSLVGWHAGALAAERALPSPATVLMIAAGDDPTATRVVAELRAAGLTVTTVQDAPAPRTAREIERLTRPTDAVAAVEIDPVAGEVRIWTIDRKAGQMARRYVVRIDDDPAVVGLRATEALRASLRDPGGTAPVQSAPAPVIPNDRAVLAPQAPPPRFGAAAGLAFASGTGPFGGSSEALLSLHWAWTPTWGIELLGVLPLTHAERTESEGSATLIFGLVGAGVRAQWSAASWCLVDAGVGAGAATIQTRGFPNGGFSGATRTTWVATPYAKIGYAVSIARPLRIRADLAAAVAVPRPTFTFTEDNESWGEPLLLASIGLELVFR
jgi:hypothetical protein